MFSFFRDMLSAFRQSSLERIQSAVLGAFIFSWMAFNWKLLAVLFFSEQKIEERISLIELHYNDLTYCLWLPLFFTGLICGLFPWINVFVTKYQDKPKTNNERIVLQSRHKIAKLNKWIAQADAQKSLAVKRLERDIEENILGIKKENKLLEENKKMLMDNIDNLTKELSDKNTEIQTLNNEIKILNDTITAKERNVIGLQYNKETNEYKINELQNLYTAKNIELEDLNSKLMKFKAISISLSQSFPEIFKTNEDGVLMWSAEAAGKLMASDIELRKASNSVVQ